MRICIPIKSQADANQVVSILSKFNFKYESNDCTQVGLENMRCRVGGYVCIWTRLKIVDLDRSDDWLNDLIKTVGPNQLQDTLTKLKV